MLQVQGIDVEGVYDVRRVLEPHGRAIKVHQHPLVGIEIERIRHLDALHQVSEFRADESGSCGSSVSSRMIIPKMSECGVTRCEKRVTSLRGIYLRKRRPRAARRPRGSPRRPSRRDNRTRSKR